MTDLHIVFALFPRITQLDFTGPHEVLWRLPGAQLTLASAAGGPVIDADGGLASTPGRWLPSNVVTCCWCRAASGSSRRWKTRSSSRRCSAWAPTRATSRRCAPARWRWPPPACCAAAAPPATGPGATCWSPSTGVTPDAGRVVRDGHVFTGGGVTAGIDMALTLMAEISGEAHAQAVQLGIEYAPAPPFDCGRPDSAAPEVVAAVQQRLEAMQARPPPRACLRAAAALA
jgi:cyclohexyl-isocyanide hydratase